jgi:hypothetical protein
LGDILEVDHHRWLILDTSLTNSQNYLSGSRVPCQRHAVCDYCTFLVNLTLLLPGKCVSPKECLSSESHTSRYPEYTIIERTEGTQRWPGDEPQW